jgi:HPt (histidine-containing phosphotransfer) domain-containing protein
MYDVVEAPAHLIGAVDAAPAVPAPTSAGGAGLNAPTPATAPAPTPAIAPAPASAPDAAVLDPSTLDRIRDLHRQGGPNLLSKLSALYLTSSNALIGEIRAALTSGDADGICRGAHALKSSSSSVGAFQLAEHCSQLETAGQSAQLVAAHAAFAELVREHSRVVRALDALAAA